MKFLVFGSGGMAGHTISTYLMERGHNVDGFDRFKVSHCKSIVGDVRNDELVKRIIENGKYDTVINCIGLLNHFAEENEALAVYLNAYFPHYLADLTAKLDTQVIHMSTDCVFSGGKGGYTEVDFRDGKKFYDRSKALGELEDRKNLTMRNSIIGPDLNEKGIGLFNWFMQQKGPIRGYTKALWTGLSTLELAKAMEYAAQTKASGLYNMVYNEPISKYDLLQLFNKYFRNNQIMIESFDDFVLDKSLVRTRFDLDYQIPDYETMVHEMVDWVKAHSHCYPHYDLSAVNQAQVS